MLRLSCIRIKCDLNVLIVCCNHTLANKQYYLLLYMNLVILTAAELNYYIPGQSVVDPPQGSVWPTSFFLEFILNNYTSGHSDILGQCCFRRR